MFLHDFTYVDAPAATVLQRLLGLHEGRLSVLATTAAEEGEQMRVRVGPAAAMRLLSKQVTVEIGTPYRREDVSVLPMTWRATGVPGVFPMLQADLEVASLGPERTQLTLLGRYDPPLGAVGRGADRLLMQRIALASVRDFLHRLAEALASEEPVASRAARNGAFEP